MHSSSQICEHEIKVPVLRLMLADSS